MDERARPPIGPGERVTAARVIEITGCTMKELEVLRRTEVIKPVGRNSKNWALYDDVAVHAILDRRRRAGNPVPELPPPDPTYTVEQAMTVFRLIKEGLSLDNIALQAQIHPRMLRAIVREYELFSGAVFVFKETLDKMNELAMNGTFPLKNGEMIYDVMALATQDKKCRSCKRRPKSDRCSGCERQRVLRNVSLRGPKKGKAADVSATLSEKG